MSRPEPTPDETLFYIRWRGMWEPCSYGDCYTPVYPDLRLCTEPLCFYHGYMRAPEMPKKGRR